MRKLIPLAFLIFILTGCLLYPLSLMYGERRHSGLIEGSYEYTASGGRTLYSLTIIGDHEEHDGADAVLRIYTKQIGEYHLEETVYGNYSHSHIVNGRENSHGKFESFHVDELVFEKSSALNFNGRVSVHLRNGYGIKDGEYGYGEYLYPRLGTSLYLKPVDDWDNNETRPGYPTGPWYYVSKKTVLP